MTEHVKHTSHMVVLQFVIAIVDAAVMICHPLLIKLWACVQFSDGTVSARTALMHEAYINEPGNAGLPLIDFDDLAARVANAESSCLQVPLTDVMQPLLYQVVDSALHRNAICAATSEASAVMLGIRS